jgi:hypothetical protein
MSGEDRRKTSCHQEASAVKMQEIARIRLFLLVFVLAASLHA